jgi:predicted O-methyltransferase YrrM
MQARVAGHQTSRAAHAKVEVMQRTAALVALSFFFVLGAAAQRPSPSPAPESVAHPIVPKTDSEKRIIAVISEAVKAKELYANVPAADGRMLRLLAEAVNAKNVVEIGTSTGISGMWFAIALERTGGHLTTFELDHRRAELARAHFRKAGVERLITLVEGDAHQNITRLKDPVDIVFIDAEKEGYVDYLNKILPLVRPGGLILAHNVNMVADYVKVVTGDANLETSFYMEGNQLAVTLKKR